MCRSLGGVWASALSLSWSLRQGLHSKPREVKTERCEKKYMICLWETLRKRANEGGFTDKSLRGLGGRRMAVKDTEEILFFFECGGGGVCY